jgi:voltage-gated potassium channel
VVGIEDRASSHSWLVAAAALRAVLTASALVALYYVLPLDHGAALVVELAIGILVFVAVIALQVRAILRSEHPEVRGLAALFVSLPLFIVLFASAYYMMSRADSSNFTSSLSRTDALYFTVTIFSTVGFGDITAKTESARLIVTAQIVLDLIIIGLGARIILGAVQRSREQRTPQGSG